MGKGMIGIGGFAAASLAAMAWLFWSPGAGPEPKADPSAAPSAEAEEKQPPRPAARPAASVPAAAAAPSAASGPPPLDCRQPTGNALVIGSEAVTVEEFCKELAQIAGVQPQPVTPGWRKQAQLLRQQIIDARLVRQALAAEGASVGEAEVDAALTERLKAPQAAPGAQLDAAATQLVRSQLRQRLEIQKLLQLRGQAKVSDAELLAAYQAEPQRFGEPATAAVLPYLWRLPPSAAPAEVEQAQRKAEQFVAALRAGTPVEAALQAAAGQAMPRAELAEGSGEPELVAAALQLAPQQWSAPLRTRVGWAVVQVLEVKPAKIMPFDQGRDRVRAYVLGRQGLEERQRLLTELRAAAKVVDGVVF